MEIVGLNKIVPNEINNLIAKFVGVKMHPIAKMFKERIEYCIGSARNPEYTVAEAIHFILVIKKSSAIHQIWKAYYKLRKLKSDKARREEFIKLQRWVKIELIKTDFYINRLFKDTKINRAFLTTQ